jgi:hypothetical protein
MPAKNIDNETLLKQLIQETEIVGMSEKEALEYIQAKLGRTISDNTLYRYKQQIRSDPERNAWLSYYARAGFVDHYRDLLAEMQLVQRDLMKSWMEENARSNKTVKDKYLIQQLARNIRENVTVLSQLGLGAPIIASMKTIIDQASTGQTQAQQPTIELKEGTDYQYEYPNMKQESK